MDFDTGHHHQHPHQASHYDDGGHHLRVDTPPGHHSNSTMKRSVSVPIIPVLEAIHFDHDHIQPYTPQNESLMEREIKIVREREDSLRMARGLGPLVHDVMHEIEVTTSRSRIEDQHNPEELSKKYAENRLRTELQREKQREMDLLMLGKIKSLSEHRKGDMVKYVDRVSSDTEELREFTKSRSTLPTSHSYNPHVRRTSLDVIDIKGHRGNFEVEAKGSRGHFEVEGKGHHGAVSHGHPGPGRHTLARTSSDDETIHHHSMKTTAEKRIELEVAEAKRRENELRELRKSLLLQIGGEHSHEVKHPKETHHSSSVLETQHGHTTIEVHTEKREVHGKAVKGSLHREGSDDSGDRSASP